MALSKILVVHNSYQQPGGEDTVFNAETALLRQRGHEVTEYREDNGRVNGMNRITLAARTIWSRPTRDRCLGILRNVRPDVAHFHNTFPLVSPSAYSAFRQAGVPIVQTLHNYRLLCPTSTFFRDGHVCEDCLHKTPPWPGVMHGCYRGSCSQTAVVAAMLTVHRCLKTWKNQVDMYVALTEFSRRKFIEAGIPPDKIVCKPNSVHPDPGIREGSGSYALFVGRLSPEKGLFTLLRAWQHLKAIPLKIAGDGPLMGEVKVFLRKQELSSVEVLGHCTREKVLRLMKGARFLVFPSEWYEGFALTIVEAFACGVPVLASRLGVMAEIIEDGRTGLHFKPGDAEDLKSKVEGAWRHPEQLQAMGRAAREEYEQKYTAERNYQRLMEVYQLAIERRQRR